MRNSVEFLSRDGATTIHGVEWLPNEQPGAILQICHGMLEYIERYDEFATYLTSRGYYVIGHDHLGHGQSVQSEECYGFFHESCGNEYVVGDIHQLRTLAGKKYPGIPYYILGHSMGSFLLRQYLIYNSEDISGAIIMGTGYEGAIVLNAGMVTLQCMALFKGWRYRSPLFHKLVLGSYNKPFEQGETPKDWVNSDREKRKEYLCDPLCNFRFTISGYYHMFAGMKELTKKENLSKMVKTLPIYFVSGAEDPVGDFGRSVKKVFGQFKEVGMKEVSMQLYNGDRHEILNETDREQVYEDIYNWMNRVR